MKKDLGTLVTLANEAEGQLIMADMPEPITIDKPEAGEPETLQGAHEMTLEPEPTIIEQKPVKPTGKPVASDKTVIKNLRAEVRKLTEELAAVHEQLELQEQKNVILFNQRKEVQSIATDEASKLNMAQEILHTGIVNTLNAFNAILRK